MAEPNILQIIAEKVANLGTKCSEEDKKAILKILTDIFVGNKPRKEAIGFKKNDIEFIYSTAVNQYKAGKYEEASNSFLYLFDLDNTDPRFPFGLGASLHKAQQYEKAAHYYSVTSMLDKDNPYPWFHSADCYLQLKRLDAAEFMLIKTIHLAGDKPEYAEIKEMADRLNEFIKVQKKLETNESEPKQETEGVKSP